MAAAFTFGCRPEKNHIRPPFAGVSNEQVEISFEAEAGGLLELEDGTRISIPPLAFVNQDGEIVRGEIIFRYTQLENQKEILVSGVPMHWQEDDNLKVMESAGMFELEAFSKKERVELAPDKEIMTQIASNIDDPSFDLFYFDQENGIWNTISPVTPIKNPAIDSIEARVAPMTGKVTDMDMTNCFVLNYNYELDISYPNFDDIKNLPAAEQKNFNTYTYGTEISFNSIMKLLNARLEAYGIQFSRYVGGSPVRYKGKDRSPNVIVWQADKEVPASIGFVPDIFYSPYVEIKPLSRGRFQFIFGKSTYDEQGKWQVVELFNTIARPKMLLKDLYKTPAEGFAQTYDSLLAEIEKEKIRLQNQKKVIREFAVRQLGVYNYDIIKTDDRIMVKAKILVDGEKYNSFSTDVYVLPVGENTVLRYTENTLDRFVLYDEQEFFVFTLVNEEQVAMLPGRTITAENYLGLQEADVLELALETSDLYINTMEDVDELFKMFDQEPSLAYFE